MTACRIIHGDIMAALRSIPDYCDLPGKCPLSPRLYWRMIHMGKSQTFMENNFWRTKKYRPNREAGRLLVEAAG